MSEKGNTGKDPNHRLSAVLPLVASLVVVLIGISLKWSFTTICLVVAGANVGVLLLAFLIFYFIKVDSDTKIISLFFLLFVAIGIIFGFRVNTSSVFISILAGVLFSILGIIVTLVVVFIVAFLFSCLFPTSSTSKIVRKIISIICAIGVLLAMGYCTYFAKNMDFTQTSNTTNTSYNSSSKKKCSWCGKSFSGTGSFCSSCNRNIYGKDGLYWDIK